ncbi:MAG: hypothetical protein ACXW2F_10520 [Thermoanaerobaculia bacterium]
MKYHTPQLDRQIEEARGSNDVEERVAIYRALDQQVVREAPIVPLFHEPLFVLHKPHVRGLRTSLVTPPVRYHDVWLEESWESGRGARSPLAGQPAARRPPGSSRESRPRQVTPESGARRSAAGAAGALSLRRGR